MGKLIMKGCLYRIFSFCWLLVSSSVFSAVTDKNYLLYAAQDNLPSLQNLAVASPAGSNNIQLVAPVDNGDYSFANTTFSWRIKSGSVAFTHYELMLGTSVNPPLYRSGIVGTSVSLKKLIPDETRYWQVVGVDQQGQKYPSTIQKILPVDQDKDGIPDYYENQLCSKVTVADTDGDGLLDGQENKRPFLTLSKTETDPCQADTDGDGISDGNEVKIGVFDPVLADTNGDGVSDGLELSASQYSVHKEVPVVSDIVKFKNEYYIASSGSINTANRLHKAKNINETFKEVINGPDIALNYSLIADNNWLYACHQHGVVRFDGDGRVENNANKSAYPTNQLNFVDNQIVAGRSNNSGQGNAWEILPTDNRFSTAGFTIDDRRIQSIYWGQGVSAERFKDWVYFGGIISSSNRESTSAPAFYGAPDPDISDGVTGLAIVDLNTGPLKHIGSEAFIKASPEQLMVTLGQYPYYSITADNISWNNQQLVTGKVFARSRILFHEGAFHTLVRTESDKSFEIYRMNTTTNQLELIIDCPKWQMLMLLVKPSVR